MNMEATRSTGSLDPLGIEADRSDDEAKFSQVANVERSRDAKRGNFAERGARGADLERSPRQGFGVMTDGKQGIKT